MPWLLYPQGKSIEYQLDRRLSGPQGECGCGGEEEKSHPLPGIKSWSSSLYPSHYTG